MLVAPERAKHNRSTPSIVDMAAFNGGYQQLAAALIAQHGVAAAVPPAPLGPIAKHGVVTGWTWSAWKAMSPNGSQTTASIQTPQFSRIADCSWTMSQTFIKETSAARNVVFFCCFAVPGGGLLISRGGGAGRCVLAGHNAAGRSQQTHQKAAAAPAKRRTAAAAGRCFAVW